jgi:hypothetical protein
VLIGGIVAVVLAVGAVVGVLARRRAQDDVHSVEHYHRKLHTLEEIRAHPAGAGVGGGGAGAANGHGSASSDEHANGANGSWSPSVAEAAGGAGAEREAQGAGASRAGVAYPAGFVRLSGSSTVRLTEADQSPPPPAPPPPIANLAKPASFDDAPPDPMPATFMSGNERAMDSISHRPRRLGGPLAAIAAVAVLVVILIVTGLHSTPSSTTSHSQSHSHSPSGSQAGSHAAPPARHRPATSTTVPHHESVTPTTVAPVVSAPTSTSASGATYTVGSANYALVLSATSGACWLEATNPSTGAVLFSGTLFSGQSHTVTASGPVAVVVGAPSAFAATVNATPVTLPAGYQAPFTLTFQTPQGPGAGSGSGSG